ncbi:MAG: serine hydrolase domain-containing protein [Amphiplicatus sp.]
MTALFLRLMAVLSALIVTPGLAAAQTPTLDPASIETFLDGYVAAQMADQYPPGMMVAVATRDQSFVKAYGVADWETGASATPDTLFRIASISKTFVWTSVMMLVDEGKLDLGADVNGYLTQFKIPEAFGAPVTLNHLMTHRAGFEDTLGDFFEAKTGRTAAESLERHMPKRVAPPGLRTSYSNWGTDVAALIVENVSGVPYDEFVRARILIPVGMTSTVLHDPVSAAGTAYNDEALDARIVKPHELKGGAPKVMTHDAIEPTYAAGAAALSARDAARWLQFFLNDGVVRQGARPARLLSPQAFAVMRTRQFDDRRFAPDFAHGFMETEIAGHPTFGHGGTLSGFIADMTVVPSLGLGVFVVVNGAEGTRVPDAVSRAIIEQFAGAELYASPWAEEASPETIEAAKALAGTYLGDRRLFSKFEKIASLGGEIVIAAEDDGSIVVTAGGQAKRLYPFARDVWTDRGRDRLYAYRGADGEVVRVSWSMGTNTYERVGFAGSSSLFYAGAGAALVFSLTVLLGAWRRQGRMVRSTRLGALLAAWQFFGAVLWMVFLGVFGWAMISLSNLPLADIVELGWPPKPLLYAHYAAMAAAVGALMTALATAPAFTASGWTVWRKIHHVLFAIAGLFAVYALYEWRVILAPMTTT